MLTFIFPDQSKEMEQQMQDELLKAISELQMVSVKQDLPPVTTTLLGSCSTGPVMAVLAAMGLERLLFVVVFVFARSVFGFVVQNPHLSSRDIWWTLQFF